MTDQKSNSVRWYVPAFRGTLGNVIPCGTVTVCKEYAQAEMDLQIARGFTTPRFVAFRDVPEWKECDD